MAHHDAEIEELRTKVTCAVVLEKTVPAWKLDGKESTRHCLKYRRGEGEILIVNHEGRGWWDPQGDARGDVFGLVQHLEPGLNFGQVRKVLRGLVGIAPTFPEQLPRPRRTGRAIPIQQRWDERPRLRRGSSAWRYLARERALPDDVLQAASASDVVREGPYGSAWFAHRHNGGAVTHIEVRGADFKGSVRGGSKTVFRFRTGGAPLARLLLAEAPIDALSRAALEELRPDTLYAATGGGMGPGTIATIEQMLRAIAAQPSAELACATDANRAGDRYAVQHQAMAEAAGVAFVRLRPPIEGGDWNDALKTRPLS